MKYFPVQIYPETKRYIDKKNHTSILQISNPGVSPAPLKFSSTNVPGILAMFVIDIY